MFTTKHEIKVIRRHRHGPIELTIISLLAVIGTVGVSSPVAAAPTCASVGITVTPLHGSTFYTDDSPSPPSNPKLTGNYEGFKFTNGTGVALNGTWSKVDTFNAGSATSIIGLAPGEDGLDQLNNLGNGASDNSYFFLQASPAATDSNAQTHTVRLFDSRPDLPGAVELCSTTFTYARVISAIQAAANKVDISTVTSNPPGLGAIMVMTVTGSTGTIGSGEVLDPDSAFFQMGPATVITGAAGISGWRPDVFELVAAQVKIDLGDGAGSVDHFDFLKWKFTGTPANQPYVVVYTFRIVGTTTSNINPSPVQNISSGTQTKHTNLSNFGSAIQPIQPAVNGTTISKSANPVAVGNQSSTNVTYTVTATNNGAVSRTVTDGVTTNNSTTVVSATAGFTGSDVGKAIIGTGIPTGSAIVSITNATTVVITSPATSTGSGRTLTIGTSQVAVLDNLVDTLPAGITFVNNSAQFNAVAIGNPAVSGSTLTFVGPFSVPAASTRTLTYQVSFPAGITPGVRTNSVVGYIGSAVIDTTVSTIDNVPATSTVTVVAAPVANDDAYITSLNTPLVVSVPGVLGNDSGTGITITSNTDPSDGVLAQNGDGSFTYTPNLNFFGTDSYTYTITDSVGQTATATVQITVPAARLTLNKSLPSRANSADQVTVSILNGANPVDSATTVGAGTSATTGANTVDVGTFTLSEAMAAGSVSSIGQYTNSISCTNSNATSTTVLPAGPGTSFTVTLQADDDIACTFTNTPQSATVRIMTSTVGGVAGFDYSMSNLSSAATTVTTAIGMNPASSTAFTATALNTNTLITETVPSGWQFTSATCSDANAAVTGNPASFGILAAPAITVPAANMRAGADITCSFTNNKLATLTISKTAIGGAGSFNYTDTGLTPASFSLNPNPPTTPTVSQAFVNLTPGTYTVTELASAGFRLADITCADLAGGATGSSNTPAVASGLLSVTLVDGADYNCTFTNIKDANISVIKNTVGGDGTFTFTTVGTGNTSDPAPSITTTAGTGSDAFTVSFGTATPTRTITITEDQPPVGWVLTAIACTNASAAPVGVVDLPTRSATFTANPGDAISCRFTNEKLPTVVIRKQSLGGTDTFSFSGGTNGLPPSVSLNTGSSNPISSSAITLTALNVATSITETVPTNYTLTSAVCVDESATPVSTSLAGGTLTIDPSAVVGGADLTCTFTNTRKSAQVRFDKAWVNAQVGNGITLSAVGGTNNPTLVAVADTTNEVDAGAAVTVYAGETLTLSETFDTGSATNYATVLACSGAADGNPADGLSIVAADDGASVVCTYTNTGLPDINATKAAGTVNGPTPAGDYTVTYVVTVANTGITPTTYGGLVDTPAFDPNLQISGATWTTSASAGAPPVGGNAMGAGPYTLALPGTAIGATRSHTYSVTVTFSFLAYTALSPCGAAGTGLHNSVTLASGESTTADNDACVPPPAPPSPSVVVVKTASPTTVTGAGQSVDYSFAVTNDGNVTLTAVDVADPLPGLSGVTCLVTVLAPSASTTCTATYITTQADIDGGVIDNTATASGVAPNGSAVNDTDSETITATQTGSIDVQKTALPTTVSAAGQTVDYSFAVTNNGNVTLTAIDVADPLPGLSAVTCLVTTLAPAASMTCTATYTTTQADIDAGAIDNTATATGTPPFGPAVSDDDPATVVASPAPSIDLQKTASPTTVIAAGQTVTYSFLVTNSGNVTLSLIGVSDPIPGLSSITCPASTLAPAASTTCTATRTVTLADINFGSIPNTATVTGTPPIGPAVSDTDSETVAVTQTPSIDVEKTASPTTVTAAGQTIDYSFLVTNTGNVTLTSVGVADPLPGLIALTCPATTLDPGDSTTCTATYVVTLADMDAGAINNTATASGASPSNVQVTDASSAAVTATQSATIDVVKTASPTTVTTAGQSITYSFEVTNTGNVTLNGLGVVDPLPGLVGLSCPVTTLIPATSTTCTATYLVTQADIDAGAINNTATASGTPPTGPAVTDSDTATVTVTPTPSVDVQKSASPTTVTAAGQTITYSFEVTNTGAVTLTGIVVMDPLPGLSAVTCPASALAPGASTTCSATYLVTQTDIDAGAINNLASVSGTPPTGPAVTDTDPATVLATQFPSVSLVKSATPITVTAAGQSVTYSFVVTNGGNVTLTGVGVSDPLPGLSGITCPASTLAPAASTTCTASYVTTQADIDNGQIDNTATASAAPPVGAAVTATDSATVTSTPAPSIGLVKSAGVASYSAAGQVVTFTFRVTNTGNVTLSGIAVSDPLPGLGPIACPSATLAPTAGMDCAATYTITQSDVDTGQLINAASVSATPPVGPAVTDADTVTLPAATVSAISLVKSAAPTTNLVVSSVLTYSFLVTNTGNVTLTGVGVSDPFPGLSAIVCPTTTLAPAVSVTCTATYSVTLADVDAGVIYNLATASGTPPSGSRIEADDTNAINLVQSPQITLTKTVAPSTVGAPGSSITFTLVATNTGNVTLNNVVVNDPMPGLSVVNCGSFDGTLAPLEIVTCTASYVVTQADINLGSISNTATVVGSSALTGASVADTGTVSVVVSARPEIRLVKSVSPTVAAVGAPVIYTFVVTNVGNVRLTGVAIADPLIGLSEISCPGFDELLEPGESITCTASYIVGATSSGSITNRATVSGVVSGTITRVDSSSTAVLTVSRPVFPATGADSMPLVWFGGLVTVFGWLVLLVSRRRIKA